MPDKPETYDDVADALAEVSDNTHDVVIEEPDEPENYSPVKFTLDRQKTFLENLAETGNVTEAARATGIDRYTVYKAKKKSERFSQLWDQALEIAWDMLESEARKYATEGKKTYEKRDPESGEVIEERVEYSEKALMRLLEAHRPEKFAKNGRKRYKR